MRATNGLTLECFGRVARVEWQDGTPAEAVQRALAPAWRPRPDGPSSVTFTVGPEGSVSVDGALMRDGSGGDGLRNLELCMRHHLAEHAPGHVFIHAGVASLDGVGIVIPGRSMSGKTTLVHELVQRGATYHSDEYAVVDPSGLVHPFARRLTLRPRALRTERGRPAAEPGRVAQGPVRAGLVIATHHLWGGRWNPRRLTAAEGALVLFDNAVVARSRPHAALDAARDVARNAACWQGERGEADETAEAILELARELAQLHRLP